MTSLSLNTYASTSSFKFSELPEGFDAIYGKNDIEFITNNTPQTYKEMATGITYIVKSSETQKQGDSTTIYANKLERAGKVCRSERFSQNKAGGLCTGFLISEDLVLTAGHCIDSQQDCYSKKFIFGVNVSRETDYGFSVASSSVYNCAEVISRKLDEDESSSTYGLDFAIVKLDRKVKYRHIFELSNSSDLSQENSSVYLMGHPMGLANSISHNGKYLRESGFKLNVRVDSFQGNSGAPLLDKKTNKVVGMLTSGRKDFEKEAKDSKSCREYSVYSDNDYYGESAMKIEEIKKYLK